MLYKYGREYHNGRKSDCCSSIINSITFNLRNKDKYLLDPSAPTEDIK